VRGQHVEAAGVEERGKATSEEAAGARDQDAQG